MIWTSSANARRSQGTRLQLASVGHRGEPRILEKSPRISGVVKLSSFRCTAERLDDITQLQNQQLVIIMSIRQTASQWPKRLNAAHMAPAAAPTAAPAATPAAAPAAAPRSASPAQHASNDKDYEDDDWMHAAAAGVKSMNRQRIRQFYRVHGNYATRQRLREEQREEAEAPKPVRRKSYKDAPKAAPARKLRPHERNGAA